MTFDIAAFDTQTRSEAGVPMPILNPKTRLPMLDSQGREVTITLLGPASAKSKDLNRLIALRRADMASRNVKMTDEDFDQERNLFLCGVTTGWSFDSMNGQPFGYSEENANRFWADKRFNWVAEQAWSYAQQEGNYLPS